MGLEKQRIASRRAGSMAIKTSTLPSPGNIVTDSDTSRIT